MPHSVHHTPRESTPNPQPDRDISKLWWNINQPEEEWTKECPAYLSSQSEKNIGILVRKDDEFTKFSWEKCQELVRTNHIDHFQRSPSQLRGYVEYLHHLKKTYSSVLLFIQHERLKWVTITPSGDLPFENPFDFKTLCNDWPYLVEDGIEHLVVWTKFLIDDDAATGKVTKEAEEQIEAFIRRTFCEREDVKSMNRESIVWFKNWKSIKSVHALEHFHILLDHPPKELLEAVTQGDRPSCETWKSSSKELTPHPRDFNR